MAIRTPLHQNPKEFEIFSNENRESFVTLQRYLHPHYINMHTFMEDEATWPTIGEVQDYLIWSLTGNNQTSSLDPAIAKTKIGDLQVEQSISLLNSDQHQQHLLMLLYNGVISHLTFENLNYCSKEELTFIHEQFSGQLSSTATESKFADDFLLIVDGNNDPEGYRTIVNKVKAYCSNRIVHISSMLTGSITRNDIGVLRSLTRDKMIEMAKQRHFLTGRTLGAMLSTQPHNEWIVFLKELGINSFGPGGYQIDNLISYLELYVKIPEYLWSAVLDLPGLKEDMRAKIIACENVFTSLRCIPSRFLESIFNLPDIWNEFFSSIKQVDAYMEILALIPNERVDTFLLSSFMMNILNNLKDITKSELQAILIYMRVVTSDRYIRFMKSEFFMREIFYKGYFISQLNYMDLKAVSTFLSDATIRVELLKIIHLPSDITKLYLHNLAQDEAIHAKAKILPMGAMSISTILGTTPQPNRTAVREKFGWLNLSVNMETAINDLLDYTPEFSSDEENTPIVALNKASLHIANLIMKNDPGIIFVHGSEFHDPLLFSSILNHLPTDHWHKIQNLLDLSAAIDFNLTLIEMKAFHAYITDSFLLSTEKFLAFINLPIVQKTIDSYLEKYGIDLLEKTSPQDSWKLITESDNFLKVCIQKMIAGENSGVKNTAILSLESKFCNTPGTPAQETRLLQSLRDAYKQLNAQNSAIVSQYSRTYTPTNAVTSTLIDTLEKRAARLNASKQLQGPS